MLAVGHSVLVIIYHVLSEKKSYEELGGNYFNERERQATEKQLVRRLEKLGYQVSLQPPVLAVSICEKRLGSEHPDTIAYHQHLTRILSKIKVEQDGDHHPAPPPH